MKNPFKISCIPFREIPKIRLPSAILVLSIEKYKNFKKQFNISTKKSALLLIKVKVTRQEPTVMLD